MALPTRTAITRRHDTPIQLTFNWSAVCSRARGGKVACRLQQPRYTISFNCRSTARATFLACKGSRSLDVALSYSVTRTHMHSPAAKESRRSLEQRREPRHANITPFSKYGLSIFGTRCTRCNGQLDAGLVCSIHVYSPSNDMCIFICPTNYSKYIRGTLHEQYVNIYIYIQLWMSHHIPYTCI